MATVIEYAEIAARVYNKTNFNRIDVPTGWTELEWQSDMPDGFSAGVYKKSNEIVIGFTGTNEKQIIDFAAVNIQAKTSSLH